LTPEEVNQLQQLRQSRTALWREVRRAQILWRYHAGETVTEIARALQMTRNSAGKWIARGLALGLKAALKDAYHRPRPPVITDEARAWVVHLACSKPKELGYAAELWTRKSLARHVRHHAMEAGHPSLARAAKATVHRILAAQPLHPEKVTYYLEHRDPHFEAKMREVLLVYQEVALQNATPSPQGVGPRW
jgi:transposase